MEFRSYITGFVDGEGSFTVSFNRRAKLKTKIEVRPSFSISQPKRNLRILQRIQRHFGVGGIRFSKRDQNYRYEVRSIDDLVRVIIPHFEKYPLQTTKKQEFELFKEICRLVHSKHHLNQDYLRRIIDLAYMMHGGGKRRYPKAKLLRFMAR